MSSPAAADTGAQPGGDAVLGGRVRLRQPKRGYRSAIDPVFLAAAVPAAAGETVLDVGAGVGAAALCLAARLPGVAVTGLELQPGLTRLGEANAGDNGCAGRVRMVVGDLRRPPPELAPASFDHVMTNPPYMRPGRGRPPAAAAKMAATVETAGLAEWLAFCRRMARPGGSVTVVHRGDRLDDLLGAMDGLGGLAVFPLWPGPGPEAAPAKRVLVQGRTASRAPLRLLPGLVLHGADGAFSDAAQAVLRDAQGLDL